MKPNAFFTTAMCLLFVSSLASAQDGSPRFWGDAWRGWHFYEDPELEPQRTPVPSKAAPATPKAPASTTARPPELLEFERLQKTLEDVRNVAIMRPTEANVRRYMELESQVVARASTFADVAQRVAWSTPELDPTLQGRPVNAKALEVFEQQQLGDRSRSISELGRDHVLIFFFRTDCPYCHAFPPTLEAFQVRHGIRVEAVSVDGGAMPGFPGARRDNGTAMALRVSQVPAVYLVFELFAGEFNALALNLYQNFRAQPLLRRMQNAMVKVMDPPAAVPDADIAGPGGSIGIAVFKNNQHEAESLAERIQQWISDGVAASEIAILISRQAELYAQLLIAELQRRGVPYRSEQTLQDLAAEPAARFIVDFLRVVVGKREADAYGRLMDILLSAAIDEEATYKLQSRWHRFIDEARDSVDDLRAAGVLEPKALRSLSEAFVATVSLEILTALSSDYEQGTRLDDVLSQTQDRVMELLALDDDPAVALARFGEDSAVRIMTIHKSKGLEFDTVVMLGVEKQTYWGKTAEERSAFFVGISRAKRQLLLTVAEQRDRPDTFGGRWDVHREAHMEFLGYAQAVS